MDGIRNMESIYEYGSRAGVWRILRLFDEYKVPCTAYAVGMALEKAPKVAEGFVTRKHELASHGYRWVDRSKWSPDEEAEMVRQAIRCERDLVGRRGGVDSGVHSNQGNVWDRPARVVLRPHRERRRRPVARHRCEGVQGGGRASQVSRWTCHNRVIY